MDCNEARPLLDANADRELPAPDARRVQQHIESCEACRGESENLRTMSHALRAAPYHRAPQSLRSRILAGLPETQSGAEDAGARGVGAEAEQAGRAPAPQPLGGERPRRLGDGLRDRIDRWFGGRSAEGGHGAWGAASRPATPRGVAAPFASGWLLPLVVAFGALAVTVTLNLRRPADFAPFADELVASHVRAQVSGRDIDVISTDRHTVKPWFNGRLDYSPPVEDLAASGFALEGGRLDYLAHRRVAVLVYRYRKHVIDVYVFPQTGGTDGSAPAALAREGYSLAHWDAEGMTWWAITDAAPDALSGLETALKARLAAGSARTESG
jgi:anti-sigma factor RsiW